jgi:hypothetical protein
MKMKMKCKTTLIEIVKNIQINKFKIKKMNSWFTKITRMSITQNYQDLGVNKKIIIVILCCNKLPSKSKINWASWIDKNKHIKSLVKVIKKMLKLTLILRKMQRHQKISLILVKIMQNNLKILKISTKNTNLPLTKNKVSRKLQFLTKKYK